MHQAIIMDEEKCPFAKQSLPLIW